MKDVCVKAKAKMGNIPSDDLYEELLALNDLDKKKNILKRLYPSIDYNQDTLAIEYDNFKAMHDELTSMNYFLEGNEKKFFNLYFSKHEILYLQEIIEALVFENYRQNYLDFQKNPLSANFILTEDMDLESFINLNNKSPYYRILLPFINKGMEKESVIFLSSNQLIKFYYRKLIKQAKKFPRKESQLILDFLGEEINLINFEIIYRLKKYYNIGADEIFNYLIDGGRLYNAKKLKTLSTMDLDGFLKEMDTSKYAKLFVDESNVHRAIEKARLKLYRDQIRKEASDILYAIAAMNIIFTAGDEINSLLELDENFSPSEKRKYLITR